MNNEGLTPLFSTRVGFPLQGSQKKAWQETFTVMKQVSPLIKICEVFPSRIGAEGGI
jgi:hypothetical protein